MRTVKGEPIHPVLKVVDADLEENGGSYVLLGRVAQPVYEFTSEDRPVLAGPATPVYVVSQAQLDAGEFRAAGGPAEPIGDLATLGAPLRPVQGKAAVPVFVVT